MNHSSLWQGSRFDALVQHLQGFSESALRKLASLHGCPSPEPVAIALRWCANPEQLRQLVDQQVRGAQQHQLLSDLVLDHDLPVPVGWGDRAGCRALAELGLIHPIEGSRLTSSEVTMPGALALILAPRVRGMRPSLPLLLGRLSQEQLDAQCEALGVPAGMGFVPSCLAIMEWVQRPEVMDDLLELMEEPDWIGVALMALELGGLCYWQEIFGAEPEAPIVRSASDKVVPLMRFQERLDEQGIAHQLQTLGILYRIEDGIDGQDSVAVPEELWEPMWRLGQEWLLDWMMGAYQAVEENASRAARSRGVDDPLARLKWLAVELSAGPIEADAVPRLQAMADAVDPTPIELLLELVREAGLVIRGRGRWTLRPERLDLLEGTRAAFVRKMLVGWCVSEIGWSADRHIGQALGVDDPWRVEALALWRERRADLPSWLRAEGVETDLTGAGYLRTLEHGSPEVLEQEVSIMDIYVANAKLLWLDMISMLEPDRWYAPGLLTEILQLCFACALFDRLESVLREPALGHYLPVQRPSFITDSFHSAAFNEWVDALIDTVLAPLGLARREAGQERVWLDTRPLRLDSVEEELGISDELRIKRLSDMFQREDLPFKITPAGAPVRPALSVATLPDPGHVSLDLPIHQLIDALEGATIIGYHGKTVEIT
jgi:hypothetical protein